MNRRNFRHWLVACAFLATLVAAPSSSIAQAEKMGGGHPFGPDSTFYVPQPNHGAIEQFADLMASQKFDDAALIRDLIATPQAVWFTSGTPAEVERAVRQIVLPADARNEIPILVAYYVPGRDCSQYSAGGAPDGDAYMAWIDAFAAGLDQHPAYVMLEPDGLALLPTDCGQPDTYGRVSLIHYAANALAQDANAKIYLDAGHSAWHAVGDMAARLADGGVMDVDGFFSNVSNYRAQDYEEHFDKWISQCIAFANDPEEGGWRLGHYDWCASQYYSPFGPVDPNDISTWHYSDEWYDANMGTAEATTHFVIDTSRNGQGPWVPGPHPPGDAQDWCNPPDRGLGVRPTTDTSDPLIDAYLWLKIPGESDGLCYRWTSGPNDPVRNMQDPPAGQWFPQMALELVHEANPPLQ